ncbi:MAG: primosomal protein N', partial [Chromatiales bacterium]|nr:primosomal protein N' [Chromatiales bacterium]
MSSILKVALPLPLNEAFDYLSPAGAMVVPGVRVRVGFGRRRLVGVVLACTDRSEVPATRLKPVQSILDETPLFSAAQLELLRWAAAYYHEPIGEVLMQALPARLRQGLPAAWEGERRWRASAGARGLSAEVLTATLKRAPAQAALLAHLLAAADGLDAAALDELAPEWRRTMKALCERGLAEDWYLEALPPPLREPATAGRASIPSPPGRRWPEGPDEGAVAPTPQCEPAAEPGPPLSPAQQMVVDAVLTAGDGFTPWLLEGVTGSGKTEVYLQLTQAALARGRQVLVLVPEIGLTPQLVDRFRRRLATPVAVLHSGLADGERLGAWLAARDGRAGVVIGTRSAVFVPLVRPGLVIVDEEHDASLKQQDGFRYHARDLAVLRAQREGVPVLLGSATPSFESLANVERGQYRHLHLPERAGSATHPRLRTLDLRVLHLDAGLSEPLIADMRRHLDAGGQVLLFINRRGFAPTLLCQGCGWVADCPRCDARMTLHAASERLRCHHCGHEKRLPARCPKCGGGDLLPLGQGTERVEQALARRFPDYGVARIDRDTTRRKGALENLLEGARSGRHRILVGTQMLAKGHDFPDLSLVGILDADQGLFSADFRGPERMAQLITQVAGRAGRAERPGEVVIQTRHPEHPLLQTLLTRGYRAFCEAALAERR